MSKRLVMERAIVTLLMLVLVVCNVDCQEQKVSQLSSYIIFHRSMKCTWLYIIIIGIIFML